MQYTASKLFKYHSSNLRFLETALENNATSARTAIRTQNKDATKTFVRVHHLLLGAWAEVRLCKLLNEHQSFNTSELGKIENSQSQLDKWNKVVELAFRRRYNVKKAILSEDSLEPTTYHRYQVINGVINNELKDIIELRNRIAHGQWAFLLNSEATKVEADKMEKVRRENLQSLIFKKSMINFLANLIHDLVVSPATFERDFDKHYKGVRRFQKNIANKPYADYESKLIASYQNGKQKQLDKLEELKQQIRTDLEIELRPQIRDEVIAEIQSNQKPRSFLNKLKDALA